MSDFSRLMELAISSGAQPGPLHGVTPTETQPMPAEAEPTPRAPATAEQRDTARAAVQSRRPA